MVLAGRNNDNAQTVKYYIVSSLLTLALLSSILFLCYRIYHHDLLHLKQQVVVSLNLVSAKVSQDISRDLHSIYDVLAELTQTISVEKLDGNTSQKELENTFNRLKKNHLNSIELYDSKGAVLNSVSVPEGQYVHVAPQQYFQYFQIGKEINSIRMVISDRKENSGNVLFFLMPVFDAGGCFVGAVSAFFKINQFVSVYTDLESRDLYFWLLGRDGDIVFYPAFLKPFSGDGRTAVDVSMEQFMSRLNRGASNQGEYISPDGVNILAVASVVDGFGKDVFLVFATPEQQVRDLLRHFHTDYLLLTLGIVFCIIGGSLFVLRAIIRWNRVLHCEIVERKEAEKQNEQLICGLEQALSEIKVLSGFLPICAACKKIRDDQGYWNQIEVYISKHSKAQFSHGICPDCCNKLYPKMFMDEKTNS